MIGHGQGCGWAAMWLLKFAVACALAGIVGMGTAAMVGMWIWG